MFFPKQEYISNIPINNGYGIMHRRDGLFPLGKITFEGLSFPAPADPSVYLSELYHNYMDIPPEDRRKIHALYLHPELV